MARTLQHQKRVRISVRALVGFILGALLLILAGYLSVAVVGLVLDTPDPVGVITDDASAGWDSFVTLVLGRRSFDPPAAAEQVPAVTRAPAAAPTLAPGTVYADPPVVSADTGLGQIKRASPQTNVTRIPVYSSFDFLSGYLNNLSYPVIITAKPWDNGSVNYAQLKQPNSGNSYWDYWIESEPWDSPNHMWKDDQGAWHTYTKETTKDASGHTVTSYVLVDRNGPGVMDKLWFTHDPVSALFGIFTQPDPPELKDWGNLDKLGNLRIEVDGKVAYDGPIQDWMSGDALHLTPALKQIFVWNYGQFGSDGIIIPMPYQKHIKISVYGGPGKPKWFMATGVTLPATTRLKPFTGSPNDLPLDQMNQLAQNVLNPESYINLLPGQQTYPLVVAPTAPSTLSLPGAGTIMSIHFQVDKTFDPKELWIQVRYGSDAGIDMPLVTLFGEPNQISLHHSTPLGILDTGDSYLFYSNLPMPYQNGIEIQLSVKGKQPIPLTVQVATSQQTFGSQLRVQAFAEQKLVTYGTDYKIDLPGSGKVVGLVLQTLDQQYDRVPRFFDKATGKEDIGKRVWPMGYLEGNLTLTDGAGNSRYYSGQEDWAEGGYYFDAGYTVPPGGSNRPFGGVLRYRQGGNNGYATLFHYFNDLSAFIFKNGLHLSFGHGTWNNNFAVTYAATVYYYAKVPGAPSVPLPASDYAIGP